jgi:hypothetical protein
MNNSSSIVSWPEIPFAAWADTAETLHLWTQIVGKVRMVQTPWLNHSWHVTLYVTPRGLSTGTIPHGSRTFALALDFFDHELRLETSDGKQAAVQLEPQSTADFYRKVMELLEGAGCPVRINTMPNEIAGAIPFDEDDVHGSYDPESVHRWWQVLSRTDRLFREFRADFWGKCSPSHFFWGSFDLAVTRFSGRTAPDHPGGLPNLPLWVAQEAYSHEVSSAGFWPGSRDFPEPILYSYAYPTPEGMAKSTVRPAEAYWSGDLGEFVLPLAALKQVADPDQAVRDFLHSTFDAAAHHGQWDLSTASRRHFPASS